MKSLLNLPGNVCFCEKCRHHFKTSPLSGSLSKTVNPAPDKINMGILNCCWVELCQLFISYWRFHPERPWSQERSVLTFYFLMRVLSHLKGNKVSLLKFLERGTIFRQHKWEQWYIKYRYSFFTGLTHHLTWLAFTYKICLCTLSLHALILIIIHAKKILLSQCSMIPVYPDYTTRLKIFLCLHPALPIRNL